MAEEAKGMERDGAAGGDACADPGTAGEFLRTHEACKVRRNGRFEAWIGREKGGAPWD